jgi:hypothetical protein
MKLGTLALACAIALVAVPQAGGTEDGRALTSGERVGMPRDFDLSVASLRARAADGDAGAEYEIAHLQFVDLLPQRQAGETVQFLTAAAEAGNDQAALLLARMRELGWEAGAPDPVRALAWYERVAATASTPDLRAAAAAACARLRSRMSATQVAQAGAFADPKVR